MIPAARLRLRNALFALFALAPVLSCASPEAARTDEPAPPAQQGQGQATAEKSKQADGAKDARSNQNDHPAPPRRPRSSRYSPPVTIERQPPQPGSAGVQMPPPRIAGTGAPNPPGPSTVNTCDPNGCWGAGGTRYEGGAGNVYLDGSGRQCMRSGTSMQCR